MTDKATPGDGLGPLPVPDGAIEVACGWAPGGGVELMMVDGYTDDKVRAYALQERAAERERIKAALMSMHDAAKGNHNYYACAVRVLFEKDAR